MDLNYFLLFISCKDKHFFLLNKSPFYLTCSGCCIFPYHLCRWHGFDFMSNDQNWDIFILVMLYSPHLSWLTIPTMHLIFNFYMPENTTDLTLILDTLKHVFDFKHMFKCFHKQTWNETFTVRWNAELNPKYRRLKCFRKLSRQEWLLLPSKTTLLNCPRFMWPEVFLHFKWRVKCSFLHSVN